MVQNGEDLAAVDERRALGGDVDLLRNECVTARVRLRRSGALPRLLRHFALVDADERRAVGAIEHIHPACLPRVGEAFAHCAIKLDVEQRDGRGRVVVPDVVVHFLEVPPVRAALRIDGDDRRREQIVAAANRAVVIGAGVAGREVDEPQLGIDGRRVPDGRGAVHPDLVVLRPRVVADFAGPWDRVERPRELAVARIERFDAAPNAAFPAGEARVDEPVEIERRTGDRETFLPALRLHGPDDTTVALIEGD